MIIFTISSVWGYRLMQGQEFFPSYLGGSGDIWKTFQNFPYQTQVPGMKQYYMFNLGWHLQSILEMILIDGLRAPDVIELGLHHVVTIYLFSGSYLLNFFRMGGIIEVIHDSSDIFLCAARFMTQTRFKIAQCITGSILLIYWIYTRIFVFSWIIYVGYSSSG